MNKLQVLLVLFLFATVSCNKKHDHSTTNSSLDSAFNQGYEKGMADAQAGIIDTTKIIWHRPGHIQESSVMRVMTTSQNGQAQEIINYGIIEDDKTKEKYFFFNLNDKGEQLVIDVKKDIVYFERLANAPKIYFGSTCYELVYPIGINLGPDAHMHPCGAQYKHPAK